jgi:hypothetical protein
VGEGVESFMDGKARSREIRSQIRRVLMKEWDPIGVKDTPEAADEYDMYIGGVYRLLKEGAPEDEIFTHLRGIETGRMELTDDAGVPLMADGKRRAAVAALTGLRRQFVNLD